MNAFFSDRDKTAHLHKYVMPAKKYKWSTGRCVFLVLILIRLVCST